MSWDKPIFKTATLSSTEWNCMRKITGGRFLFASKTWLLLGHRWKFLARESIHDRWSRELPDLFKGFQSRAPNIDQKSPCETFQWNCMFQSPNTNNTQNDCLVFKARPRKGISSMQNWNKPTSIGVLVVGNYFLSGTVNCNHRPLPFLF